MYTFLSIVLFVILYLVFAGATSGYAKHRWPPKVERRQIYMSGVGWTWRDFDDNSNNRGLSTVFWPFYWLFIWPFTKVNEVTFSRIEKTAALEIARKKSRIENLRATKAELEEAQAELEKAELEVEEQIARL